MSTSDTCQCVDVEYELHMFYLQDSIRAESHESPSAAVRLTRIYTTKKCSCLSISRTERFVVCDYLHLFLTLKVSRVVVYGRCTAAKQHIFATI